jgi:hypothetical protein
VLLNLCDNGLQQIGKENRQQQNEERGARDVQYGRSEQKYRYSGNYIGCAIID